MKTDNCSGQAVRCRWRRFVLFTNALKAHMNTARNVTICKLRSTQTVHISSHDRVPYLMEARDFLLLRLEKALLTFFLTPLWQGHSNMCTTHGHMNIREKGVWVESPSNQDNIWGKFCKWTTCVCPEISRTLISVWIREVLVCLHGTTYCRALCRVVDDTGLLVRGIASAAQHNMNCS